MGVPSSRLTALSLSTISDDSFCQLQLSLAQRQRNSLVVKYSLNFTSAYLGQ